MTAQDSTLAKPDELAARLRMSRYTVLERCRTGVFPHLRLGTRTVRFTAEQVAQIEANAARSTTAPQAPAAPAGDGWGRITRQRAS